MTKRHLSKKSAKWWIRQPGLRLPGADVCFPQLLWMTQTAMNAGNFVRTRKLFRKNLQKFSIYKNPHR
jgi:hypothetical protein